MLTHRHAATRIVAIMVLPILAFATPALADAVGGDCAGTDCTVWGGSGGTSSSDYGRGSSGCTWQGRSVPCSDGSLGDFDSSSGCYYARVAPPSSDPHNGEGGWYVRTCYTSSGLSSSGIPEWFETAPAGPSPEELARQALATITLLGADIGTAPDPARGSGLVGLPVWLWTQVRSSTWGPIAASASSGSLTVTIEARVSQITWNMGNGDTVTCDAPGTPFTADHGGQESPDCGYPGYTAPSRHEAAGVYLITATSSWRVGWAGGGQTGVIATTRTSQTGIQIDEAQAVLQ